MEFAVEKCGMLIIRNEKRHMTKGIVPSNQEKIRMPGEKEAYKYLRLLDAGPIKQDEMKGKIFKEYLRRTRKLLETNLHDRNLIKVINTKAVPLGRHSRPFLKRTREKLQQIDQRRRKLLTMH